MKLSLDFLWSALEWARAVFWNREQEVGEDDVS
jgi:hypothetical protein